MTVVAVVAAIAAANVAPAQSASERTQCSDIGYLNASIKSTKKAIAALKLIGKDRYAAALAPAKTSLWIVKHSPEPCDSNYWLSRRYEIHYGVALQRYVEEMKNGDYDSADGYWSDVEFWGDQIRDLGLED
jgi:hypothetical protein